MKKSKNDPNLKRHAEILRQFHDRTSPKPTHAKMSANSELSRVLPGIKGLMSSFATASPEHRDSGGIGTIKEWNPFSQRIYLYEPAGGTANWVNDDFRNITAATHRMISTTHEANHVLLWEPFFTGKFNPESESCFSDVSLCFEGHCFWYADAFAASRFRARLPDGEFVLSRSSLSIPEFHPYRAFKALGVTNERQVRQLYYTAFRGKRTRLSTQGDAFTRNLAARIVNFYSENLLPTQLLYGALSEIGYFSEFFDRYCNLKGIPSLLPDQVTQHLIARDPETYCHEVFEKGMPYIEGLSHERVELVRCRRAIQTRAYCALSLESILTSGNCFSRNDSAINPRELLRANRVYLARLQELIQNLAGGAAPGHLRSALGVADGFFDRKVRSKLKTADAWSSNRGRFFPQISTDDGMVGFVKDPKTHNLRHARNLVFTVMSQFMPQYARDLAEALGPQRQEVLSLAGSTWKAHQSWKKNRASEANFRMFRSRINRLLSAPGILEQWSVPLYSMNPAQNSFRELLFSFE